MRRDLKALPFWSVLILLTFAGTARAHFVWVDCDNHDGDSYAVLFFGESPKQRDYHLPESIASAELISTTADGKRTTLDAAPYEAEGFVGLRAAIPNDGAFVVSTTREYGVYHGTLLTYAAKHIRCESQNDWAEFKPSKDAPLEIVPTAIDGGIACVVYRNGERLADAEVTLTDGGPKPAIKSTDKEGRVVFYIAESKPLGLYVRHIDAKNKGTLGDENYSSATYYATLSLDYEATEGADVPATNDQSSVNGSDLPPLRDPVASFGGAVLDEWLYVYGGHTGGAHDHSSENLVNRFARLDLNGGTAWEDLPMQTPLQGLALVANGEYLYRIGGMNARNAADEEEDLHSLREFARFDPRSKTWKSMPPLPEARSSHDAVVVGDVIYVIGGWALSGPGDGAWLESALSFDLANPDAGWTELPSPPFQRRALAVGHCDGKVVAIGGMDSDNEPSLDTDFYNIAAGKWESGPQLTGEGIRGFGVSAWNLDGTLVASGANGKVLALADDLSGWIEIAQLRVPRFFHRLLPGRNGQLLAVAGASFERGHLDGVEFVQLIDSEKAVRTTRLGE